MKRLPAPPIQRAHSKRHRSAEHQDAALGPVSGHELVPEDAVDLADRGHRDLFGDPSAKVRAGPSRDPLHRLAVDTDDRDQQQRAPPLGVVGRDVVLGAVDLPFVAADEAGQSEAHSVAEANRRIIVHTSE